MSYTFTQTGSEIQAILDRAEIGGQLDQDIAAKQDALTFDAVPTQGSTNPAESGGIYDAIQAGGAAALAAFATDSVSGDVVSFPDGASNIPVKSFVGSIVPVQSGSGDPSPTNVRPISGWSGAEIPRVGKNLLDKSKTIVERAISNTGSLTTNARCASATEFIYVGSTATVTVSASSSVAYIYLACYDETQTFMSRISTANASSHAFNLPSGTRWLKWCINYDNSTTVTQAIVDSLNLQLELGSSASTYEAYDGQTIILDIGINQWDEQWELGGIVWNTGEEVAGTDRIRTGFIPVAPNSSFYVHVSSAITSFTQGGVVYYDASQNWVGMVNAQQFNKAYTAPSNARYMRFVFQGVTTYSSGISINSPASITGYYPYTGRGPVYAGTITALGGGKWSVQPTMAAVDMGSLTWTASTVGGVSVFVTANGVVPNANASNNTQQNTFCSVLAWHKNTQFETGDNYVVIDSNKRIIVRASSIDDVTALNSLLSDQPLVYELAALPDPIIVSGEDLQTLLGSNTVWLDCGSVTELEYRADTALYIQKLLNGSGALSMASPSPSLSLGRVGVLLEQEEEPEVEEATEEPEEQPEEQAEEE